MAAVVPGIEVADDRDRARVRRPDSESRAAHPVDRHRVGAEGEGDLEQPPFIEQMQVGFAQQQIEGVGISTSCTAPGHWMRKR